MPGLTEIYEKLETIDGKVDNVRLWQATHTEKHNTIDRDITEFRDTLYHNPEGLVAKVNKLLNCKNYFKNGREFWMNIAAGIIKVVAAGCILSVIGWLLFIYKKN